MDVSSLCVFASRGSAEFTSADSEHETAADVKVEDNQSIFHASFSEGRLHLR